MSNDNSYDAVKLLGTLAVERGWVKNIEVQDAIAKQKEGKFFGEILLSKDLITTLQLEELLILQHESEIRSQDFLFGQMAVHNKFITAQEVINCLEEQKLNNFKKNLGEILIEKDLLTEQQCSAILSSQKRIQKTVQIKNKKVSCPKCQTVYKIKDPERLRKIRCSHCQYVFEVGSQDLNLTIDHTPNNTPMFNDYENAKSIEPFLQENQLKPKSNLSDSSHLITKDNERYVLGSELARGGMGKIILTKDINLRRSIVTKILLNKKSKLATLRFIEEAQITGQLEHPNIPPVYDLGINKDHHLFFTMKQIKGETLQQVINKLKEKDVTAIEQYSFNSLINIFTKVCNALAFAHSKKVIHRDIKPENIMVGEYGEVLLMDWGLAKIIGTTEEFEELDEDKVSSVRSEDQSTNTLEGTTAGTPAFMSPEQAKGHFDKIDQRADIYSLGATLFNVLALERPVKGKNVQDVLNNAADGKIQKLDDDIPPELNAITLKAMAYDAKNRYQSIKEMEKDLINYQMGYSVSAKQDSSLDMIKKFYKRNKLLAIITTSFLVIFLITSIIFIISLSAQKNTAIEQKEIAKLALQKAEIAIKQFEQEKTNRMSDNKKSAPTYYAKAQIETQNFNTIDAEKLMDTALSYESDNQEYLLYRGCLAFTNNNFKKAIEDLSKIKNQEFQPSIFKILELISKPNLIELDEMQKTILAEICCTLKLFDIAQKLTSDFQKKLEYWNKKLTSIWGKGSYQLAVLNEKEMGKSIKGNSKLTFIANNKKNNIDYSPLIGIPIQSFLFQSTQIANLNFMENMPIEDLAFIDCPLLTDLSPLKNIKLKSLTLINTKVKDLTPLSNSELDILVLKNTPISTLKPLLKIPLKGIELHEINLTNFNELQSFWLEKLVMTNCKIENLEFLNTKSLIFLVVNDCRLKDISKLADTYLSRLEISKTLVVDISPIKNKDILVLNLELCKIENLEVLLTLKKLETLIITPNSLAPGWDQIIYKMKDQIRQISVSKLYKFSTATQFITVYKPYNYKNQHR